MTQESNTNPRRGIYLVGFSGAGKSTVARLVADKLGWRACDLDDIIVERAGLSIPEIFQKEGEAAFRMRETDALRAVALQPPFVIATGGGTIVGDENRALMAATGWIILLEAQPAVIHARIQQHRNTSDPKAIRPLLDTGDPLAKIRALKDARQSAYNRAHCTIHTDHLTPEQVANEVVRTLSVLENASAC